jgi:hypothetical protein
MSAYTPCDTVPPSPGWKQRLHIKGVADLLGHSSISITGDIYGRTSDATTWAAIDGLSRALGCES